MPAMQAQSGHWLQIFHVQMQCWDSPYNLGRERNECGEGRCSVAHKGYVIFFRIDAAVLRVIAVLEGHLDTNPVVRERG
jgi:hypothetical protein